MKNIKLMLIAAVLVLTAVACSNDDVDKGNSIFPTKTAEHQNDFDKWLYKNYTEPYNIRFNYKYVDQNSNLSYNVKPAELKRSIALAKIIKHVWLDAYTELMGPTFLKEHCFREFQLIGSAQYNGQGSITLGFAEGGVRVNLFQVNNLDFNNLYIEEHDPYNTSGVFDLNFSYFHTMHQGKYHSSDWVNVSNLKSGAEGFVTGYASGEYNEDFAEVFACYVTDTDEMWQKRLAQAVTAAGGKEDGKNAILAKLSLIRSYLMDSWGVDIDKLRKIVLRREGEISSLDLETLN